VRVLGFCEKVLLALNQKIHIYKYISFVFWDCEKDKHFIKLPATEPNILKWLFMEILKQQQKKYTGLVSPEGSIILSAGSKL